MYKRKISVLILLPILILGTWGVLSVQFSDGNNFTNDSTTTSTWEATGVKTVKHPLSTTDFDWRVQEGDQIVYDITKLNYNGTPEMEVVDAYNESLGYLEENDSFIFTIGYLPDPNGEGGNEVWGYISGRALDRGGEISYHLVDANETLSNESADAPLLYFVIPIGNDTDFTRLQEDFENNSFTVVNNASVFSVEYQNDSFIVSAAWSKDTGVMLDWYFNGTVGENGTPLEMHLELSLYFNPEWYYPYWALEMPIMAYNITTLELSNGSTRINMGEENTTYGNDALSGGYLEEGQVALISIDYLGFDENGPTYDAYLETPTGYTWMPDPFGEEEMGGPPLLALIFPVSDNATWWDDFGTLVNAETGMTVSVNNATEFGLAFQINETSLELTWDKETGILEHYAVINFPYQNETDPMLLFSLELDLIIADDMADWVLNWGVQDGDIYLYHFDEILINENNRTLEGETGYFEDGQNATLQITSLPPPFEGSPTLLLTSLTGIANISDSSSPVPSFRNGPPVFIPIIPKEENDLLFDFLEVYYTEMGADVTNDANTFELILTDQVVGTVSFNLTVSWDKTTGLLSHYRLEAVSTLDATDNNDLDNLTSFILEMTLIGKTDSALTPPTSTTESTTATSTIATNTSAATNTSTPAVVTPAFDVFSILMVTSGVGLMIIYRRRLRRPRQEKR